MTTSDNDNPKQKIFIATTDEQTADEQRFVDGGIKRAIDKRDRQAILAFSETTAAAKFTQKVYAGVEAALEGILSDAENRKGGPKPKYLEPIRRTRLNLTADLAVRVCFDAVGKKWTLTKLLKSLGKAFNCHLFAEIMNESRDGRRLIKQLERGAELKSGQIERRRDYILKYAASKGWKSDWDEAAVIQCGAQLYNAVRQGCDLFEIDKSQHEQDEHPTNRIVMTEEAQRLMDEHNIQLDLLTPTLGPMNRPPRPWDQDQIGPYYRPDLAQMVPCVKNMRQPQREAVEKARAEGTMEEPLAALNYLGEVPFVANEYVVDAISFVINGDHGSGLRKFPELNPYEKPERLSPEEFAALDKDEQIQMAKDDAELKTLDLAVKASRKVVKSHVQEAIEQIESGLAMYLPYNLDFRGRIYHVPDFGYHSADYLRGLFLFAEKEAITSENHALLCLQIANSWGNGVDKGTLQSRVEWVDENIEMIVACGEDFEATLEMWQKAEAPFQFLAAARELRNYQLEGEGYMSGIPIALDAAQSGVAIFAAASRAEDEGRLVNLTPNNEPQDFYSTCLEEAKRLMAEDLELLLANQAEAPISDDDDDDVFQSKAKRDGKIRTIQITLANPDYDRSKIKRQGMTKTYGSNQFGFARQIRDDWMADYTKAVRRGLIKEHPYGADRGFEASVYLGNVHDRAICNVLTSVAAGMNFYQACASALAKEGKHFHFTAKTGFPMYQHYVKAKQSSQRVTLYNQEVKHRKNTTVTTTSNQEKVNSTKSVNAISANITHCTDAAILTKAVLLCRDHGITNMMCVHDSFSTSIGSALTMSWAIRRAFVDFFDGYCLYEDVLNQVREQLDDPDNADLPEIPAKGTLDLEGVMHSDYNFC